MLRELFRSHVRITHAPRIGIHKTRGATLIELAVGIGLLMVLLIIVGSVTVIIGIDRANKHLSWATALAKEELEMVASQPFANLSNRTNASFAWVPYNYGTWRVITHGTAVSAPQVYELVGGAALTNSISGLALVPLSQATTITFQSSIQAASDSPAGWKTGIAFGMKDHDNYYRLRFSSSDLLLEKVTSGTASTLYSLVQSFTTNTWYTLKVVTTSTTIEVWLDGLLKNTYTGTIDGGEMGLLGLSQVHALFDDVSITTGSTTAWNFDSDPVGAAPSSWSRFGLYDFYGANGTLTIADYNSATDNKQITVTITWPEIKGTRNVTLTTLKNKYE